MRKFTKDEMIVIGQASLLLDEWLVEQIEDLETIDIVGHEVRDTNEPPCYKAAKRNLQIGMVVDALRMHHGNAAAAARHLGLARSYVHRLMRRQDVTRALLGNGNGNGHV